jgi:adenylate cyclase
VRWRFRDLSISRKLTLIMMLATCIVLALASAAFVVHEIRVARRAMVGELTTLANAIATNTVSALTFNDPAAAMDTLAALRSSPTVVVGHILRPTGEVFARYVRTGQPDNARPRPDHGRTEGAEEHVDLSRAHRGGYDEWGSHLVLVRPIVFEQEPIGLIYIKASFDELNKATGHLFAIVGAIAGVLFAVALVLAYRLQRVISDPIVELMGTIKQVSRTKNYKLQAEKRSDDELGVLIDGFNDMLKQIDAGDQQLREEVQILELSHDLAGELNLDTLLSRIMHATTELLSADRGTLFLYDKKTNELFSRVAEGLEIKEIRIPTTSGIAGAVFTTRQTANIADPYRDPRFNKEVDRRTGYRTESILAMPIVNKAGEGIGVTEVLNKKGGGFTAKDEARLGAFTAQITVALENAKLFEDVLNEKNYNEGILRSTSDGIITLDAEDKILTANDAALRILKLARHEVIKQPVGAIFAGANTWVASNLEKVKQSGHREIAVEKELRLGPRETASVNLAVNPLIDVNEEHIGSMIVLEDITSEKRMKSTMARYMSPEVADQLLAAGEAVMGGKDQKVSILFSDVRNFTSMSETLGARETVSMLNEYFERMVDVIFSHRGVLDKFIGDAVMALFGVPFNGEHDADDAVQVANAMFVALRDLNRKRKREGKDPIDIGVGISTGVVVVGNIGSTRRMEYTVIGDSVNLASRLESATKFYGVTVLISEYTRQELKSNRLLREIDRLRVQGKHEPVAIYEAMDHFTGDTFPNLGRMVERYAAGIRHYRAREWKDARACFQEALKLNPADKPSQLYVERCEHFLQNPPPGDWDGVWTMTTK